MIFAPRSSAPEGLFIMRRQIREKVVFGVHPSTDMNRKWFESDGVNQFTWWITDDGKHIIWRWKAIEIETGKVKSFFRKGLASHLMKPPDGGEEFGFVKGQKKTGITACHLTITEDELLAPENKVIAQGFTTDRTDLLPKGVDLSITGGAAQHHVAGNRIFGRLGESGGDYCADYS